MSEEEAGEASVDGRHNGVLAEVGVGGDGQRGGEDVEVEVHHGGGRWG